MNKYKKKIRYKDKEKPRCMLLGKRSLRIRVLLEVHIMGSHCTEFY